ncbi:MAG: hypothetical protein HRU19_23730 [Pseudobacteriovorax sp.]|nr:hypothetical protein [Pseudobacteriovorax sp.]
MASKPEKEISISIPSLSEQEKIVQQLEKAKKIAKTKKDFGLELEKAFSKITSKSDK